MAFPFDFLKKIFRTKPEAPEETETPVVPQGAPPPSISRPNEDGLVKRHFFNEAGFQTYGSFFSAWDGWITAGHVLDESKDLLPPFANGEVVKWPAGLDAATIGCVIHQESPKDPVPGQTIHCIGYPAGSAHPARRDSKVYMERPGNPDTWIAHVLSPDEPVVTGMSGGAVFDTASGQLIGIIITRNSPADLDADRDPDESFDFVSLAGVWRAVQGGAAFV